MKHRAFVVSATSLLLAFAIISCGNGDVKERIPIGEKAAFLVLEDEQLVQPAPKAAVDRYGALVNPFPVLNVPMYRYVKGPSYDIFIGIALPNDGENPVDSIAQYSGSRLVARSENGEHVSLSMRRGDTSYVVTFPAALSNPRMVVAYVTTDSTAATAWFTDVAAMKRIGTPE
ncbi:MAG TPA: hypothetical protein DIS79_00675 [Bacteroidetes bacterium]|nr:hypothetical protein [Bacteroidota bacterium]HRK05852.1 hypothetical protein [Chlorobiota bacterium]